MYFHLHQYLQNSMLHPVGTSRSNLGLKHSKLFTPSSIQANPTIMSENNTENSNYTICCLKHCKPEDFTHRKLVFDTSCPKAAHCHPCHRRGRVGHWWGVGQGPSPSGSVPAGTFAPPGTSHSPTV